MSLERASSQLGWPEPREVIAPRGAGASVITAIARAKLQRTLVHLAAGQGAKVGLLLPDPTLDSTPSPLAVVCEFSRVPPPETLNAVHRLGWNFCRAPLLLTLDPTSIRAWTCCETPLHERSLLPGGAEIAEVRVDWSNQPLSGQIANALHWVNLVSGRFFLDNSRRFTPDGRADQVLLSNLKTIRRKLHEQGLKYEVAHDLLGRIIFIQFLFQRTDSSGRAALNQAVLSKLADDRILRKEHTNLEGILSDYDDAYSFFRWLNDHFNGDLFPGKGATATAREREWQEETAQVRPKHLNSLAEFVGGRMLLDSGQRSLFPFYSFDTIPLELISSIYEEFVSRTTRTSGLHYTPSHVVDLILDGVLPWSDTNWDVKILDPACGSGIFLVKAFQRLIHRWRLRYRNQEPAAADLRNLLENNIFGVDIHGEAVRVASFSLYLAMCDEIEPKYYWTQVNFPRLRDNNLHRGDFFALQDERPDLCRRKFDIVVGNAPWGQATVTPDAAQWANARGWSVSYGALGPLFLPRAAELAASGGVVSMLQPSSLLTNSVGTAQAFRRKLLSSLKVEEVINLSALRFGLFADAVDPACIVTLRPTKPDGELISYVCPKPTQSSFDDYRITLDPQDVHLVSPYEAADDDRVWSVFIWGGRRDLSLVRKLAGYPTLGQLKGKGVVRSREGIIRGDRQKRLKELLGRRVLEPAGTEPLPVVLDARTLPINRDDHVDLIASTDFSAFELPQLLIKQAWTTGTGKFEAAMVRNSPDGHGVLCSQSFLSVSSDPQHGEILNRACLVYNSIVAVYYLLLTSGRFASYRPEPTVKDLLSVPVPIPESMGRGGIKKNGKNASSIRDLFDLTDSEWSLVEDLFNYTLPDFKGDSQSPGRLRTTRGETDELGAYSDAFMRVLCSGFGSEKRLSATIFEEPSKGYVLPVRMLVIHLDMAKTSKPRIQREHIEPGELLKQLEQLCSLVANGMSDAGRGTLRKTFLRLYTTFDVEQWGVPSVVIVKPDQVRYWTRTAALRDADDVGSDVMKWGIDNVTRGKSRVQ
jgi:hypothetical protein